MAAVSVSAGANANGKSFTIGREETANKVAAGKDRYGNLENSNLGVHMISDAQARYNRSYDH